VGGLGANVEDRAGRDGEESQQGERQGGVEQSGGGGVRTARVHEEGAHAQQEAGGRASTGGSIVRASEDEGG
jgi:hypothetical protein